MHPSVPLLLLLASLGQAIRRVPSTLSEASVPGPAARKVSSASSSSGPAPPLSTGGGGGGGGPKCGKGFTYCGYMLQNGGHNFAADAVNKTYCAAGAADFCPGGVPRTHPDQAVFVCLAESPAAIQLLCACGNKCLNSADSNNIAHCDAACSNSKCGGGA